MVDDILQLQAQLDAARSELLAAQNRVSQLEAQLSAVRAQTLSYSQLELYDQLFDELIEACQIIGFDWRYLYLNKAAAREGRNERSVMLGRTVMEIYPDFETTEVYAFLNRSLIERIPQETELRFPFPDGSYGWYEFRVQPIAEGIFVYSQEITPRKLAEENLRRLYRTLGMLSDTNQAIVRMRHSLPELFQTICDIAVNKGGFVSAAIGELTSDGSDLHVLAETGLSLRAFDDLDELEGSAEIKRERPTVRATHGGQRIVMNQILQAPFPPAVHAAILARGIQSFVVYPLKVSGQPRGVFVLTCAQADFFNADELRLLDEMAGDLEYAMEFAAEEARRIRAEHALQNYAQRLEVLHAIDRALLRAASFPSIVNSTLSEMRRLIPCERAGVVLFDKPSHEAVLYMLDTATQSELQSGQRTPMPAPDWIASFSPTGVKNIGDLRQVAAPYGFYTHAVKEGMVSILHVLLVAQDEPLGLLNLLASHADFFTPEYTEIAVEIGNQLAIAIHQMHLTQAIERHTAELETRVEERTRQLRAENERIQAILHYSLEGIAFLDADFQLVETNAAFRRLINYAAYATTPTSLFDLLHPDDHQRFSEAVNRALAESGGRRFEIRLIKPEQAVVNAEIGLQNITDDGFVCSFHDIDDRQRAEQALRLALEAEKQANMLKSRFVSMASHEFRTPLAAILASTETLTLYRDRMKDDDIAHRLDNIRRQVTHMAGIMENVLQLGHMQSGRLEFKPTQANLHALCAELVEEFNNRPATNNRVVYAAPDAPIILSLDVSLMRQSITNLIGNALKYSENPLPVQVQLSQDGADVRLHIRDQGIGVPAKDLPYLFEPFYRASNVGGISGTGLGLSITKQAIELHGGSITVDSQEGHGTTFTITLPVPSLHQT